MMLPNPDQEEKLFTIVFLIVNMLAFLTLLYSGLYMQNH